VVHGSAENFTVMLDLEHIWRDIDKMYRKLNPGSCLFTVATVIMLSLALTHPRMAAAQESDPYATDTPPVAHMVAYTTVPMLAQSLADRAATSAQELAIQAMALIGIRYTFGGRTPDTGFDCSGLVRYVFNHVTGRSLPHNSFEMARMGTNVDRGALQPGDLVFYNTRGARYSHVGIYIGDGRFIHAPSSGGRVHIVDMQGSYWLSRFNGARRLPG